ncbi:MAG: DUF386 domain-containing protein [Clostridiales bacterium]|jgi:YhcH/YjgK/YiaL family protein|nr:DUF386 domain-containing protein [Clostridiales bacterium]
MIFDTLKNLENYKGISKNLDAAIDFIVGTDFQKSSEGKTDVCEAFYFTKATVETRDITDAPFEAHKKYIDIFIPLTGREIVKTADIGSLTETYPYQDADDFYLFEGPAQVNAVNTPETFAMLFPQDAHNSAGGVDGEGIEFEKIVVKVRVE